MIERFLPFFATLLARTLRFRWSGEVLPEKCIVMFWHGEMFAGWYSVRKRKPIALVSASKDGNFLAAVLTRWGYKLSRGSTKKSGMEALLSAMQKIQQKECSTLVITPDGPRGPRHIFKRGAFIAAKELNLPIYMLRIQYGSKRTLKSWDKFEVPMPFSSVSITSIQIDVQDFSQDRENQEMWLKYISQRFSGDNVH